MSAARSDSMPREANSPYARHFNTAVVFGWERFVPEIDFVNSSIVLWN
jgi:hypothetical protein